jgi:hypothetical protein
MSDWAQLDDKSLAVSLKDLASINIPPPQLRPLSDFSILSVVYQGDLSSLFRGTFTSLPALIETCTRIPYTLVCREVKLLSELDIPGIVRIEGVTKNRSLGIVTLAYRPFDFQPWTEPIPPEQLGVLLLSLLKIVAQLHAREIHHSWICRSSVYVSRDLRQVTLGSFHAACRISEPQTFVPRTSCSPQTLSKGDRRPDDVYSAGMWCLSYLTEDIEAAMQDWHNFSCDKKLKGVLRKMVKENPVERVTAEEACALLREFVAFDA